MSDKLIASEALFGFCGWLTTRKEITVISEHHEVASIVKLIMMFCEENKLADPREEWEKNLMHPSGECSGPAT